MQLEREGVPDGALRKARAELARFVLNPPHGPTIHVFPGAEGWRVLGAGEPHRSPRFDDALARGQALARAHGFVLVVHRPNQRVAGFQRYRRAA